MKLLNRFGAVLLAAALVFSNCVVAMAANPVSQYDPGAAASIVIHKYQVDDLDNYTIAGDGTALDNDAVVIDNGGTGDVTLGDLDPLAGISFRVTLMEVIDEKGDLSDPDNYRKADPEESYTDVTGSNGELTFDGNGKGLTHGIWLVEELEGSTVNQRVDNFLVQAPMTDPTDNASWMYTVHVYPKNTVNSGPEIGKEVVDGEGNPITDPSALGNIVNWRISVTVPSEIEDAEELIVTDVLDSRLVYDSASLKVYYTDKDGNETVLTSGTHYTPNFSTSTNTLTAELTSGGFAALANALDGSGGGTPTLYVEFATRINITEEGGSYDLSAIYNGADLDYTNDEGYSFKEKVDDGDKPGVEVGGLHILKIDGSDERTTLTGASFQLYLTEDDAKNGTNAVTNPATGLNEWVAASGSDGYASFYGLNYGTYYLVETVAPAGYNLLTEPVRVVVSANTADRGNAVEVRNFKGFTLPVTGGAGTVWFTAVGLVLITLALVLLALRLRMKNN